MVFLDVDINKFKLFRRLRDFKVPTSVLDSIFSKIEDLDVLNKAFEALLGEGYREDEAAEKIAKLILKDLNIVPNQFLEEEK